MAGFHCMRCFLCLLLTRTQLLICSVFMFMLTNVSRIVHSADGVSDGRRTGSRDCRSRVPFESVPEGTPK